MQILSIILVALVALEHLYILYMEMFAWETLGKKTFKGSLPNELFKPTKKLAANQGLYNGFLAAGLIWSFFIENPEWQKNIQLFFLGCVIVREFMERFLLLEKYFLYKHYQRFWLWQQCY